MCMRGYSSGAKLDTTANSLPEYLLVPMLLDSQGCTLSLESSLTVTYGRFGNGAP